MDNLLYCLAYGNNLQVQKCYRDKYNRPVSNYGIFSIFHCLEYENRFFNDTVMFNTSQGSTSATSKELVCQVKEYPKITMRCLDIRKMYLNLWYGSVLLMNNWIHFICMCKDWNLQILMHELNLFTGFYSRMKSANFRHIIVKDRWMFIHEANINADSLNVWAHANPKTTRPHLCHSHGVHYCMGKYGFPTF